MNGHFHCSHYSLAVFNWGFHIAYFTETAVISPAVTELLASGRHITASGFLCRHNFSYAVIGPGYWVIAMMMMHDYFFSTSPLSTVLWSWNMDAPLLSPVLPVSVLSHQVLLTGDCHGCWGSLFNIIGFLPSSIKHPEVTAAMNWCFFYIK